MAINVKPLGDRVLVQAIEETETKKGGIIIPDTAKEKPQEGNVIALGTGKLDDNGKKVEFTVKKGDKVLVQPNTSSDETAGGIVLPDTAKERPQEGKVISVGPGRTLDSGEKVKIAVEEGDTVIYSKYGGTEIKVDGESYLIMREDDILGIIG